MAGQNHDRATFLEYSSSAMVASSSPGKLGEFRWPYIPHDEDESSLCTGRSHQDGVPEMGMPGILEEERPSFKASGRPLH